MGTISKDTYRRIYLLAVVNSFEKAVYGRVRLQKTVYESTKDSEAKPFGYLFYQHGQFSFDIMPIKEQLLSMNYLSASPIKTKNERDCNSYAIGSSLDRKVLTRISSDVLGAESLKKIESAVNSVGYLQEKSLLEKMYEELGANQIERYDRLFDDNLPDEIETQLSDDQCEDIELMFNPDFVHSARMIDDTVCNTDFDISKIKGTYDLSDSL